MCTESRFGMKKISLALQLLLLDLRSALFSVLLLIVSLILLGSELFGLFYNMKDLDSLRYLSDNDYYYTMVHDNSVTLPSLRAVKGVKTVFSPYVSTGYSNVFNEPDCELFFSNSKVVFMASENQVMSYLGLKVIRGRDFCIGLNERGHYEAVVSENLEPYCPIGSVHPIENIVYWNNGYQSEQNIPEVEIVGVIPTGSRFISFSGQPELISTDFFAETKEDVYYVFAGYTDKNWDSTNKGACILSFDESLTEKERFEAMDTISDMHALIYSCRELYEIVEKQYRAAFLEKVPACVLLFLIVLLTVCGCSTMNILSHFDRYSLCLISGATDGTILGLIAIMNLYVFCLAAGIGLPIFHLYMNSTTSLQRIPCDNPIVILSLIFLYVAVFFLSLVIPSRILKKNPVSLYVSNKN